MTAESHQRLFLPSIVLGEAYPASFRAAGAMEDCMEKLAAGGFFKRMELPFLEDKSFPGRIRSICGRNGLSLTLWTSEILAGENLNLSSCSEDLRQHSVSRICRLLECAAEYGADCVGCLSGPDPGEEQRPLAKQQLVRSLVELGQYAARFGELNVAMEPLDREAHKKGLIGPTIEAIEVIKKARENTDRVFLAWDSGHVVLNNEDPVESFRLCSSLAYQMHLSNPVTDRLSPLFGDHHYPVGELGVGTEAQFRGILKAASLCPLRKESISVAVEVKTQNGATPGQTIDHCRKVLERLLADFSS